MSLMQEMSQRALDLGVPMSVHFDITYRCNERCVHCYLDHDDHGEMTTAEIKRVLDELADAGTFFLTFSGGEVLMRRDFFELLEYARNLMFAVRIKTNAVMIGEAEARRMLELGVDQVQVSIYSHRPEVHDAITKLPGSLRRSVEAIRFLTEQGLRVTIANVLMTANMRDHAGVQALARELGVQYTLDPTITPKMDGDTSILNLRIPGLNSVMYFVTKAWWGMSKSFAPRRRLLTKTSWKAIPAAPATPWPTSLLTEMFFLACSFRCPVAMCGGRNFSISGTTLQS